MAVKGPAAVDQDAVGAAVVVLVHQHRGVGDGQLPADQESLLVGDRDRGAGVNRERRARAHSDRSAHG